MIDKKIGFIGVGNMGLSILLGMLKSNVISKHNIFAYDVFYSDSVPSDIERAKDIKELVEKSDVVIFAVKPNMFSNVLGEVKVANGYNLKSYISIAAGITTDYIKEILGDVKITRVMPNLALSVGEGMTVVCPYENILKDELSIIEDIFNSCGKIKVLPESYINKAIAINGSAPAYVFMFIEALADAGVKNGLSRDDAYFLAAQTVLGSAKMVLETGINPARLKDMVCSPAGTTIEAVVELEDKGFRGAIISAVEKCTEKAIEMSNNK